MNPAPPAGRLFFDFTVDGHEAGVVLCSRPGREPHYTGKVREKTFVFFCGALETYADWWVTGPSVWSESLWWDPPPGGASSFPER